MQRDLSGLQARRILAAADLRGLRCRAGISAGTLGRALGVGSKRVQTWERRACFPRGWRLGAYARVIAGLARHEEIGGEGEVGAAAGRRGESAGCFELTPHGHEA